LVAFPERVDQSNLTSKTSNSNLNHHIELHSLIGRSNDQTEQDVNHEVESSEIAAGQDEQTTAEHHVAVNDNHG
jgi:hypothetical protein